MGACPHFREHMAVFNCRQKRTTRRMRTNKVGVDDGVRSSAAHDVEQLSTVGRWRLAKDERLEQPDKQERVDERQQADDDDAGSDEGDFSGEVRRRKYRLAKAYVGLCRRRSWAAYDCRVRRSSVTRVYR